MKGFFVYPMKTVFRFYGAAVSLSQRRSLRRGTPGHDGFPHALGIMRRHFLRRGIRTHNEIPRALGIMRPHHRDTPVGVTTRKEALQSKGWGAFLFISASVRKPFRFYGAAAYSSKSHKCFEKPPLWLLIETQVASRREIKKGRAKFDLHAKPRYSLIRKRDWRSGSALRSHRRGHWFEPSITHQITPVSRNGGFIMPNGICAHKQYNTAADTTTRE